MNDYLKHYGILGMRWGRRKGPQSSSGSSRNAKSTSSSKFKEKAKASAKASAKVGARITAAIITYVGLTIISDRIVRGRNDRSRAKYGQAATVGAFKVKEILKNR